MPVSSLDRVEAAAQTLVDRDEERHRHTGRTWLFYGSQRKASILLLVKVNTIDTSGAGDAYIGCFACCYVQTGDILSS